MKHSFNWQLVKIGDKGMAAFEAGQKEDTCPYSGRTGFNLHRRRAWLEGYRLAVTIARDQRLFDKARAEAQTKLDAEQK
jgi:ribosome modulation factor